MHVSKVCRIVAVILLSLGLAKGEEIYVRASQVGYQPQDAKIAVAFAKGPLPQVFTVVSDEAHQVWFEGKAQPATATNWGQFEHHIELDFSALKRPGRYVLQVGDSKSLAFWVHAQAYTPLPDHLLEFMRQQRCGYN